MTLASTSMSKHILPSGHSVFSSHVDGMHGFIICEVPAPGRRERGAAIPWPTGVFRLIERKGSEYATVAEGTFEKCESAITAKL